ncbi:MAG: Rieske 2Fe-2S domain-containing protein [Bacteroidetes bacterium]|nr:Rieske 2Fe-2S domain-containing protein [Bacteroidota bacterium]
MDHKTTEHGADRRRWLIGIVSALGGTSLLALAAFYLRRPSRSFGKTVRIGTVDDVFRDAIARIVTIGNETIAVVRDPATASISAMRMHCTHAGCPLELHANTFRCHCHGGAFDLHGKVIAGPPKQSLRHVDVVMDGATIYLRLGATS